MVQFRCEFSGVIINNPFLPTDYGEVEDGDDSLDVACDVVTAPPFAKDFRNRRWVCEANSKYKKYVCKWLGCKKQVRTCCACMEGYWLCNGHIVKHAVCKATNTNL